MKTATVTTDLTNIKFFITNQYAGRREEFISGINEAVETKEIVGKYQHSDLLTPGSLKKEWVLADLQAYIIARYDKKKGVVLQAELSQIDTVMKSGELTSIKVSVEWKKNRTWGSNPTAEAWYSSVGESDYVRGSSIGGCGYDKLSTSVAEVLNQINPLLRLLYLVKEENTETNNHDLFGYGSGYGILPKFEGGVGVNCYNAIFNKIGFEFKNIAWGKSYDVYEIVKIQA